MDNNIFNPFVLPCVSTGNHCARGAMEKSGEVDARTCMPLADADSKSAGTEVPRSRHHHHPIPRVEAPGGDATAAAATRKRSTSAEHSGRGKDTKRRHRNEYRDGALQCLSPVGLTEESTPKRASEEIARCLHEVLLLISAHSPSFPPPSPPPPPPPHVHIQVPSPTVSISQEKVLGWKFSPQS